MSYILYTGNNCHDCAEVVAAIQKAGIAVEVINVDDTGIDPPIYLAVFPALFEDNELKGYGRDILSYLKIA